MGFGPISQKVIENIIDTCYHIIMYDKRVARNNELSLLAIGFIYDAVFSCYVIVT